MMCQDFFQGGRGKPGSGNWSRREGRPQQALINGVFQDCRGEGSSVGHGDALEKMVPV